MAVVVNSLGSALLAATMALTAASEPLKPVLLSAGLNEVDLDSDGRTDPVVKAWRGNFNAHGFSHYAFYKRLPDGKWEVIPLEFGPGDSRVGLATVEGADCVLRDLRLYRKRDGSVALVVAERAPGESFADPGLVTFSWFALDRNEEGVPGWPPLYFSKTRTQKTAREYCDVGEAFEKELTFD